MKPSSVNCGNNFMLPLATQQKREEEIPSTNRDIVRIVESSIRIPVGIIPSSINVTLPPKSDSHETKTFTTRKPIDPETNTTKSSLYESTYWKRRK